MSAPDWFSARFRRIGTKERAAGEKAYLKSELKFHGVDAKQLREACRAWCAERVELTRAELRRAVDALYATDWFDLRSAGVGLLERKHTLLEAADADWIVRLVRKSRNWAQVDWLATKPLGKLVERNPSLLRKLSGWARDEDFWVRRTALLAQLDELRAGRGDFDLFARLAEPMLPEKEFFIRKAIGWILRDTSKKRPDPVFRFLRQHRARCSGLTLREGAKYLSPAQRAQLGL
jgi:3-methyladenine DNA glycosylase AlkD